MGSDAAAQLDFPDGTLPCKKWMDDYSKANTLSIIVSAALASINFLLRYFLRNSSKYEGHHTVTNQL